MDAKTQPDQPRMEAHPDLASTPARQLPASGADALPEGGAEAGCVPGGRVTFEEVYRAYTQWLYGHGLQQIGRFAQVGMPERMYVAIRHKLESRYGIPLCTDKGMLVKGIPCVPIPQETFQVLELVS